MRPEAEEPKRSCIGILRAFGDKGIGPQGRALGRVESFRSLRGVCPEFATASELRDALLGSFVHAEYFGGPFVGHNRDDTKPAWGWVVELIRKRSDWWPALGLALQHAAAEGGELARMALADLLAGYRDTIALQPWVDAIAQRWPDAKAPSGTGTGWGAPDLRLDTIARDRRRFCEQIAGDEVFLLDHGRGGKAIAGRLTNDAELRALLDASARAGRFPDGDKGPWSWLGFELLTRGEWLHAALLRVVTELDPSDEASRFALLDWWSEERDLWRFEALLSSWYAEPPAWASKPAKTKPSSFRRTIRSAHWPDVETLGDVIGAARGRARQQLATSPILDLPKFG